MLLLLLGLPSVGYADEVTSCHDGDTCTLSDGVQTYKVRLFGVDAPEIVQPFGVVARDRMRSLVVGRQVEPKCKDRSYKRRVCKLIVGGVDVGAVLVGDGLAWDDPRYSKGEYAPFQDSAKLRRLGIWSTDPIPPWDWRRGSR